VSIQLQMCHSRATEGFGAAVVGLDVLYDHGAPSQDRNRRSRCQSTVSTDMNDGR
jgi:hypothetical protein